MAAYSPTVRRRQLSLALRDLRRERGLTAAEVSKKLEWTPSKLTRIERNEWRLPSPRDVRDLLDVYEVTDRAQREAFILLAKESRQRGWWVDYKDVFKGTLPDIEAGAAVIRTYEPTIVPGLLQTADYARAIFKGGRLLGEAMIERSVTARLARQSILERDLPPQFLVVIDEAVLRRLVGGPEVMAAQLEHIIAMNERLNVAIQVLPLAVGAHAAVMGGFVILDFASPRDPSLVYLETATDGLYLEQPEELHRYTVIYGHAQAAALSPDESVRCLKSMIDQLRR